MDSGESPPYRDDQAGARARRDAALEAWTTELAGLGGAVERLIAERWARLAIAAVVVASYAALALWGLLAADGASDDTALRLWTLPALLAPLVAILGRRLARTRLDQQLRQIARRTDDPLADADRLRDWPPRRVLARLAQRSEPWSSAATLLLAGLALALASSACTLAFTIVPLPPFGIPAYFFAQLVVAAVWLQVVFALHAVLLARRWARLPVERLERNLGRSLLGFALAIVVATGAAVLAGGEHGKVLVLGAGAQAILLALGQARLHRRLLDERRLLDAALQPPER